MIVRRMDGKMRALANRAPAGTVAHEMRYYALQGRWAYPGRTAAKAVRNARRHSRRIH